MDRNNKKNNNSHEPPVGKVAIVEHSNGAAGIEDTVKSSYVSTETHGGTFALQIPPLREGPFCNDFLF